MPDSTPKQPLTARASKAILKIVCDDVCPQLHASSDSLFLVRFFARVATDLAQSCSIGSSLC